MENITLMICNCLLIVAIASCFIATAYSKVKKTNNEEMKFEFDFDTVNLVKNDAEA